MYHHVFVVPTRGDNVTELTKNGEEVNAGRKTERGMPKSKQMVHKNTVY
jgi:hypothetical protein